MRHHGWISLSWWSGPAQSYREASSPEEEGPHVDAQGLEGEVGRGPPRGGEESGPPRGHGAATGLTDSSALLGGGHRRRGGRLRPGAPAGRGPAGARGGGAHG